MTVTRTNCTVESGASGAGPTAHAEGQLTNAPGLSSHAEGYATTASGVYAHAEGYQVTAAGNYTHAEGYASSTSTSYTRAQGYGAVATRIGQHSIAAFPAATVAATIAQQSQNSVGGLLPAAAGSTIELTFDAVSFSAAYVLFLPLKSVTAIRYSILARPSANASATALGCCWTGQLLAGRGNATGTSGFYTLGGAAQPVSAAQTLPQTYALDAASAGLTMQASIGVIDIGTHYLKFVAGNPAGGLAYAVYGVVHCVELATTV